MQGNPGCGKTVLAPCVVKELQDHNERRDGPPNIGYYFFKSENPILASASAAYSSVIMQLLFAHRHDSEYMDKIIFLMQNVKGAQEKATSSEVTDILLLCLQDIEGAFLILERH